MNIRTRLLAAAAATALVVAAGLACAPAMHATVAGAPDDHLMAEFWAAPVDLASRDLVYGVGGPKLAPPKDVTYALIERSNRGFSPKADVRDPSGEKWQVKMGSEAQPEVVASRLVWALGYHEVPDYYLPTWTVIEQGKRLDLGPARFRPHLKWINKEGTWSWHLNPFVNTRPFRGLVVLMMVLNSTDLKDDNNGLYDLKEPLDHADRWYVVKDLGATFGETGRQSPRRGDPDAFDRAGFIKGVAGGHVLFDFNGRHQEILGVVHPDDVLWMCERLRMLSAKQWNDAFRAGGYDDETTRRFVGKIQQKIAQGEAVARRSGG